MIIKKEYEFNLDFKQLDNELIAGSYTGKELITYSDGEIEIKDIDILIRQSNSGSVGIGYSFETNIDLTSKNIDMYYETDNNATHESVVQIILVKDDEEYLLGQSGKIKSGQILKNISLDDEISNRLKEGIYSGYMRIYFNGENENLNDTTIHADIEIEINVN